MLEQDYFRPKTLSDAVELRSKYGKEARILAGGTDLIINLKDGLISCKYIIDIKDIPEMNQISYDETNGLSIGGAVSLNDMSESQIIQNNYPILIESAKTLANTLLRNRATMLGNICNASPAGDMIPSALVLDGYIEAVSSSGNRTIQLRDFFIGVKRHVLKEGEIAVKLIFPSVKGKGCYMKKSRIKGHDLAQVGVAGFLNDKGNLKISLGAVAPVPVLIDDFGRDFSVNELKDASVIDSILNKVALMLNPISDQRASREYRLAMASYLTRGVIQKIAEEV